MRSSESERAPAVPYVTNPVMYARAFSTLGCGELDLPGVFALADRHGIAQVELRALAGTIELPGYFAKTYGSPAAMAAELGERSRRIAALDTSFRLISGGETDRLALREFVPWAEALGVRWLRVFDGGKGLDAESLRSAAATLEWWQSLRREEELQVDLMIETHDVLLDADRIARFTAAMPANSVGLLWDAHHTWRRGREDPLATWRTIRSQVVHVHVKDSITVPGDAQAGTYVLPGAGEFPMTTLRAALAKEFTGTLSLEWEKLWHPQLAPLEDALRAAEARGWW